MAERGLTLLVLPLALLVAGLALFWSPAAPQSPLPPGLPAGGDFTLQSANGPVSLRDFRGKVVLVYFGYTYCPDVCPTGLITVSEAIEQLGPDEQQKVAVIFVSVDPDRDTPERLKEYTDFFHPSIVGVTGDGEHVSRIAQTYGARYARQAADTEGGHYPVDHSADIYVVAGNGRVFDKIAHGTAAAQVALTIRRALTIKQEEASL
jgi:protein SCO1/2